MAKAKKALPALKKSDLLAALKGKDGENRTDLTQESLMAELQGSFAFIPEFFNYLFATYQGAGKFEVAEDGTLSVKAMGQVRTSPRAMFTIGGTGVDVTCETGTLMPGDKLPEGSSLSPASAAKIAKKAAYAGYQARLAALDVWVAEQKAPADEAEAAAA